MTGEMIIKCEPVSEDYLARHKACKGEDLGLRISTRLQDVTRESKVLLVHNVMQALEFDEADLLLLLLMVRSDKRGEIIHQEHTRVDWGALRRAGGDA